MHVIACVYNFVVRLTLCSYRDLDLNPSTYTFINSTLQGKNEKKKAQKKNL